MSDTWNPAGPVLVEADDQASEPAVEATHSDFGRFEDLTAKLVKVPKSEIDERRKKRD